MESMLKDFLNSPGMFLDSQSNFDLIIELDHLYYLLVHHILERSTYNYTGD